MTLNTETNYPGAKGKGIKVTVYTTGMFGISTREGWLTKTATEPWAQYRDVPFIHFRKKRARKVLCVRGAGFRCYMLVVEGWGHPKFENFHEEEESGVPGIVIRTGKHTGCSNGWATDFDKFVNSRIESGDLEVVADYRYHDTHDRACKFVRRSA